MFVSGWLPGLVTSSVNCTSLPAVAEAGPSFSRWMAGLFGGLMTVSASSLSVTTSLASSVPVTVATLWYVPVSVFLVRWLQTYRHVSPGLRKDGLVSPFFELSTGVESHFGS